MKPKTRAYSRVHFSVRYHTWQRLDPVTGQPCNLRPMQWGNRKPPALTQRLQHS